MADPKFTVVLQVKQVTPAHVTYKDNYDKVGTQVPRAITDLASLELRSSNFEALLAATKDHLDLITTP